LIKWNAGRLIVTESDYDGFLAKYPLLATYLSNQLITKSAILIGYSLDDPNFRQIWHVVSERLGRTRRFAYSITVGTRQSDITRFERRGVHVINLPGSRERYGEVLAKTFAELREYLREKVLTVSTVTEERPLRELLLPRGAATPDRVAGIKLGPRVCGLAAGGKRIRTAGPTCDRDAD
jgi:hypothetical protein